jgi:hypothetical protein
LFYEDPDTKPASKKTISFGADISDGKWVNTAMPERYLEINIHFS